MVYPNPTNDKLNISEKVDVIMRSILGDIVILKNNTNVLDVSKLSSGVYNLQITHNNKIINRKIIKN